MSLKKLFFIVFVFVLILSCTSSTVEPVELPCSVRIGAICEDGTYSEATEVELVAIMEASTIGYMRTAIRINKPYGNYFGSKRKKSKYSSSTIKNF